MANSPASAAARRPLEAGALVEWFLIVVGWGLLFALPHSIVGDDNPRFQSLGALLETGRILAPRYSLIGPVLATPFYLLGKAFGSSAGGVLVYDPALFALMLAGLYLLLAPRWPGGGARRFLLLLVAASMFPRHLLHFGAEAFTATFVAVGLGLAALAAKPSGEWSGWGIAVLGAVNTPATMGALGLASLQRVWDKRQLRWLAVPGLALALYILDTYVRTGAALQTGYANDHGMRSMLPYSGLPEWSYPIPFGLLSLILSFGKGLVFFAGGLCLLPWVDRLELPAPLKPLLRLWLAFLTGLLLIYSHWWSWYGGFGAGPRFMLFASLPACLLLAQLTLRSSKGWAGDLSAVCLVALGCWVSIATTVFENGGADICTSNGYQLESLCWYTPEFSVLWNPFVGSAHAWDGLDGGHWAVIVYGALAFSVIVAAPLRRLASRAMAFARSATTGWQL